MCLKANPIFRVCLQRMVDRHRNLGGQSVPDSKVQIRLFCRGLHGTSGLTKKQMESPDSIGLVELVD